MKKFCNCLLILLAIAQISCSSDKTGGFNPDKMLKMSVKKVKAASEKLTEYDKFPRYIDHGQTEWSCVPVTDWTSGFYAGVLWKAYEYTQDDYFRDKAKKFSRPLMEIAYTPARDHDIGFMVYLSLGNGFLLTENGSYRAALMSAADTLATLYNPTVGAIHSWPFKPEYEHNTIVDNMMNLELLFWAAKNSSDIESRIRLETVAISHAEITQKYLVRPDYSTYHLGSFTKEGEFLRGVAHQGYADDSMWARGQAWGIYGFAICYREIGREDFLNTSMKLADHFIERLPEDGVPYWDFDAPNIPDAAKDASAAAVAASGMLELYTLLADRELAEKYYYAAVNLLKAISTDEYVSGERNDAILMHSTGHHPKGFEIDVPIVYADYYYLDALIKLKKINETR